MLFKLLNHFICILAFLLIIGCEQKNEVPIKQESSISTKNEAEKVSDIYQLHNVNSVIVRGKTISLGMLSDELFTVGPDGKNIFTDVEHLGKDVQNDPSNPKSLLVTHHYKTGDKFIDIVMARQKDPGSYRIIEILVKMIDAKEDSEKSKPQTFESVKEINVAGFLLKVDQEAYIPQDRLESYFVKNEGNILSTHNSYYSVEGKTIIITYGPSSDGPYIVTGIKISEEK